MDVLILAAGYGTRLYPLTLDKPKPLLPIGKRPLIDHLIMKVKDLPGLGKVYVVTNAKFFDVFSTWARSNDLLPGRIVIVNDGTRTPDDRLGSIGDIHFAVKNEKIASDLLVIGGDNLFDYTLDGYVAFAKAHAVTLTVGLYDIGDREKATKFGVVKMDETCAVTSFEEKPQQPQSTLIAMCLYYMPGALLTMIDDYIRSGEKLDRAGDYLHWLCGRKRLCGFKFTGTWYDIGSLKDYEEAQKIFS